jgi:protein SCO1
MERKMSRPAKVLTICLWIIAVAAMVGVVALQLWRRDLQASPSDVLASVVPQAPTGPRDFPNIAAPQFSLTDQLGRSVTNEDLKGRPWVADFIFTECAAACPLMSRHLADLQNTIPRDVKFVSFSVDPMHDTPPVLLAYAKRYGADNSRWLFLTGPEKEIFSAVDALKVSVIPADKDNPIRHDVHFVLMDSAGRMRGIYDSRLPEQMDQLVSDAAELNTESRP